MRHRSTFPARRFAWLLALVAVVAAAALPTAASASNNKKAKVFTRNLYLGTGLNNLVGQSGFAFIGAVTTDWGNVVATNFPARAQALADEIQSANPDLIGLQEVSIWRQQTPADSPPFGTGTQATTVVYDFLAELQTALSQRGLSYTAVATSTNADVEAPRFDGASSNGLSDVRLTDRDVILAKSGVSTSNSASGHYAAQLRVPVGGPPVDCYASLSVPPGCAEFTRGWTSVDATVNGATFRFFNTHLETEDAPPVQVAQGAQALGIISASPLPVVTVGDFNSAADGSTTSTYANLIAGGLDDAWPAANGAAPGVTCCQSELLDNALSQNATRIDLVLTGRGRWDVKGATVLGGTRFRAAPAPLWASDHAGVSAEVKLK